MLRYRRPPGLGPQHLLQLLFRLGGLSRGLRGPIQLLQAKPRRDDQERAVRIRRQETRLCKEPQYHNSMVIYNHALFPAPIPSFSSKLPICCRYLK